MLAVSTRHQSAFVDDRTPLLHRSGSPKPGNAGHEATVSTLLSALSSSMERSAPEYAQSGLPSPYPSNSGDTHSEASSADHAPAAQFATQEVRSSNYSTSATPTSEYSVYPPSARSSSFPDHIHRPYHPAGNPGGGSGGGMAQTSTSPSVSVRDGHSGQSREQVKSDSDVPIDPSIAAPSPTYPHGQFSPYAPPSQDMSHPYSSHSGGLYTQPRPVWTGYTQQPLTPGHHVFPTTPTSAALQGRTSQVG